MYATQLLGNFCPHWDNTSIICVWPNDNLMRVLGFGVAVYLQVRAEVLDCIYTILFWFDCYVNYCLDYYQLLNKTWLSFTFLVFVVLSCVVLQHLTPAGEYSPSGLACVAPIFSRSGDLLINHDHLR